MWQVQKCNEIEAFLSQKVQPLSTVFAKHPNLTNKLLDDGNLKGKEDCSLTRHDNVIELGNDNDEDKA